MLLNRIFLLQLLFIAARSGGHGAWTSILSCVFARLRINVVGLALSTLLSLDVLHGRVAYLA